MQAKIVLTERGLKLSSELVVPSDEPAPFLEEAKPPKEPIVQGAKLAAMYNTSNGYLDRVTLRSAESDRSLKNKPFFLPFHDINQSQYYSILPPFKQGKYPGIYPPKIPTSSQSTRREKQAQYQQQQQTLTATSQKFTSTIGKFQNSNFNYPLVLDLNNIQKSNGTDMHSKMNINNNKKGSKIGSPNEQISPLNLIVSPTSQEYQFNGNNNSNTKQNGFFPFPGNQTDRNNFQQQQLLTTQQKQLLGELTAHKKNDTFPNNNNNNNNSFGRNNNNNLQQQQKQFIPLTARELNETKRFPDKNIYLQNIQERLDLKKANYFHQREAQDAKLKELAAARINLSKDPVHIAAQYLDELKREDEIVDELMQDVNYFKSRYKSRLAEYHHSKYEKKWNHMQIPHERQKKNGKSYGNIINNNGIGGNDDEGEDEDLGTTSNRKIQTAVGTPNRMPLKSSMKIPSMMKILSNQQTQTKIQ